MVKNYILTGLKQLIDEETENIYYFSEGMLDNNILIEELTLINDDKVQTMISVKHINNVAGINLDAADYIIYWGELLSPIQTYRIIKDIYELYLSLNKEKFIEAMYNLSTSSYSSSMQSDLKHAENIIVDIREIFYFVKRAMK